jgi:alpha-L-fucosidase
MKKTILFIYLIVLPIFLFAQVPPTVDSSAFHQKMQWFKDAKLGIFIHWGIYAVNGISESWSFYNGYISHEDYLQQADRFKAENYHPQYWAELIKASGARYSVITTRHHDGFALWDTEYGNFNSVENSPAQRDLLAPFVKALREMDLKVGLYFSLPDWSFPDYTHFTRKQMRYKIDDDPHRWQKFQSYNVGQLEELSSKFHPDLWWFDGDWEHSAQEWEVNKIRRLLSKENEKVIFNSRLQGYGDYETPEIGLPVNKPKAKYWELCMTMNESWGFQPHDKKYKSPLQIIDIFVDCISKGGNLLLDIGPKADGNIPEEQINILTELGSWTQKHEDAIFGTRAGIPLSYFNGPSTLSKDSTTLYLFIRDNPKDGKVLLKGVKNPINRIFVVGNGSILNMEVHSKVYWSDYPGLIYIDVPTDVIDPYYTVLAVQLKGKIDLIE